VVLVGLMGAGKTSIGRRLARTLAAPFADADEEIVAAAGLSIPDIFQLYGEPRFRELERRVIARLLDGGPIILALGGGAFMDPDTRARIAERAVSVWLRADLDTLVARTARKKGTRPLLERGDPQEILAALMRERYPVYALADHTVDSQVEPHETVIERILTMIEPAVRQA
jgi:shikimate kinase